MATYDYDLLTLGAGSGGVAASRRAASYGARVAICEESRVGGTCVIRGCVPKKLLVYGSAFAGQRADAAGFGWDVPEARFDWATLVAGKNREVDRLNGVYLRMLRDAGVALLSGRAVLRDAHTAEIGGRLVTAERILVATGGHPVVPEIPGASLGITSNEALDLAELPRRIAIVGGGYIAVEFAGIFRSLGAEVTLLVRGDTVLRGFDDDVRATLTQALVGRGVVIRADTGVADLARTGDGVELLCTTGETRCVDQVMFATGRAPNTAGLGLEAAGVAVDARGAVVVDGASQTTAPNVYAVGDCTNRRNLTPVAIGEGRAFADSVYGGRPRVMGYDNLPSAVFSQPPVGTVGLSEREARAAFSQVDVYVSSFRPMVYALAARDERTLVKLVVDRATDRVLGAHMVGPDAPEIIQGMAVALQCGATKAQFDRTVGIHPTAAEEFVTLREPRPEHVKR